MLSAADSFLSLSLLHREKLPKVQLDQTALHLLLRKSTAAICAHTGYEGTSIGCVYTLLDKTFFFSVSSSRALDALSDVLGNFLSNFCKIMRINADRLCESGSLSFEDVLDQSLQQCGCGGKAELHQYWNRNIKGHKHLLDEEVERQMTEYRSLTVSVTHTYLSQSCEFVIFLCCLGTK